MAKFNKYWGLVALGAATAAAAGAIAAVITKKKTPKENEDFDFDLDDDFEEEVEDTQAEEEEKEENFEAWEEVPEQSAATTDNEADEMIEEAGHSVEATAEAADEETTEA